CRPANNDVEADWETRTRGRIAILKPAVVHRRRRIKHRDTIRSTRRDDHDVCRALNPSGWNSAHHDFETALHGVATVRGDARHRGRTEGEGRTGGRSANH